jgi:hypothetical protein
MPYTAVPTTLNSKLSWPVVFGVPEVVTAASSFQPQGHPFLRELQSRTQHSLLRPPHICKACQNIQIETGYPQHLEAFQINQKCDSKQIKSFWQGVNLLGCAHQSKYTELS